MSRFCRVHQGIYPAGHFRENFNGGYTTCRLQRLKSWTRYAKSSKGRAVAAKHRKTEKRKATLSIYNWSQKGKAAMAKYNRTDKGKARTVLYERLTRARS